MPKPRQVIMPPNSRWPVVLPPPMPKFVPVDKFKILAIVGARKRNNKGEKLRVRNAILEQKPHTIVTGDAKQGADKFARYFAERFGIHIIVREAHIDPSMPYLDMVKEYYKRNEEIAMMATHMFALPNKNGKGGTVHAIKMFKKHHEDWKDKLIVE